MLQNKPKTLPSGEELLEKVTGILDEHGLSQPKVAARTVLDEATLWRALGDNKDVQKYLYSWQPPQSQKVLQRAKNKIVGKLRNIIVNVLERFVVKQDGYNQFVYKVLQAQQAELTQLREEVNELKQNHGRIHKTSTT